MLKTFGIVALLVVVSSQAAYARHHRHGDCCCSDGTAPAAAPADAPAQPAAPPAPSARAPQSTRSYSYAPDAGYYGSDRLNSLGNPVHASYGLRSAASKANGNY